MILRRETPIFPTPFFFMNCGVGLLAGAVQDVLFSDVKQ
jgi:hypothetical protein